MSVAPLLAVWLLLIFPPAVGKGKRIAPPQPVNHQQVLEMVQKNAGNVTLVNIWASWCDPCREEMPGLVKLRNKYKDKGLQLILVSADEYDQADSLVPPVLKKLGVNFQTYVEHDSSDDAFISGLDSSWNGTLPTTFIYDKQGKLSQTLTGGKKYETFEKAVEELYK